MKFTQFKKWFSVMAFAVTALFVTQTVVHTSNQLRQNNVKNSLKHSAILSNKLMHKC